MGGISQSFHRLLNTTASINRLPVEILTRVFEIIQVRRSSKDQFPPRFAIARTHDSDLSEAKEAISSVLVTTNICSYWREVVLFTPSLWRHIHLNVQGEYPNSWSYCPPPSVLLRSYPASIHATICVRTHQVLRPSEPTELYDSLRAITNRTETLQIAWEGRYQEGLGILDLLRYPFPQLASLTLRINLGGSGDLHPTDVPETIFGGELPRLRRLSLWFYTCWSYHTFPNLTHISLHHQWIRPSKNEFLDLLESTSCLEFLFLWEAGPRIAQEDILPQRRVPLISLRFAQFTSKDSHEYYDARILECLTIPQSTRCSILYTTPSQQSPINSPGFLDRVFPHINPEGIREMHVYLHKGRAYGLGMDSSTISIQTVPNDWVTIPATRFRNINHLHLVSTVVMRIPKVDWGSFQNLVMISCDSLNGIASLLTVLSGDDLEHGCPCPFLETIYLYVLPKSSRLNNPRDREFIQEALLRMPGPTVISRNQGNSFEVVLELRSELPQPDESQMDATVTFPINYL